MQCVWLVTGLNAPSTSSGAINKTTSQRTISNRTKRARMFSGLRGAVRIVLSKSIGTILIVNK